MEEHDSATKALEALP
ncbi:hypothetical protein [uncultured Planktomarina sp.]